MRIVHIFASRVDSASLALCRANCFAIRGLGSPSDRQHSATSLCPSGPRISSRSMLTWHDLFEPGALAWHTDGSEGSHVAVLRVSLARVPRDRRFDGAAVVTEGEWRTEGLTSPAGCGASAKNQTTILLQYYIIVLIGHRIRIL